MFALIWFTIIPAIILQVIFFKMWAFFAMASLVTFIIENLDGLSLLGGYRRLIYSLVIMRVGLSWKDLLL